MEKESAFHGLCRVAMMNPGAVLPQLVYFVDAVVHWTFVSDGLNRITREVCL